MLGAIFGTLLVAGHETYNVLIGLFQDVDPFVHIMTEFAIFSGGCSAVFAAMAWIHNGRVADPNGSVRHRSRWTQLLRR
jgi:hypothetical protein